MSVLRDLGNIQYSPVTFILELITISYAALIPRRINLSSSNAAHRTDTSVRTVWQRIVPPSWKPRQGVPAGAPVPSGTPGRPSGQLDSWYQGRRITPTGQPDWPHRFGSGSDNHLLKQTGQALKKFLPVLAIFKNRFAFDSSYDDMMQRTRGVNAGMTEYAFQIRDAVPLVNKEVTSPLPRVDWFHIAYPLW